MYLTREEGWKESKLGRIYQPKNLVQVSPKHRLLMTSDYVTHLGDHTDFIKKMDYCLENLNSLIFIADGARWIWKWIEQRHQWIDRLVELMITQGITPVIKEIQKLPSHSKTNGQRNKLIKYYKRNQQRMQYHHFLEKGLLIGSGAIESAHKDVLQQRLKLSGQR